LPNIPISKICSFEGKVKKGQAYIHQFSKNLVFCLVPRDLGWYLVISDLEPGSCDDKSKNSANFAPMVSPPFHFNYTFTIFGMDFRNQDNTENK
jgi:hypothetical protein